MSNCRIRFMDNQKIESGNYTISNENSTYPFSNALSKTIRSSLFKATSNSDWRLIIDIGFPDKINALTLFAPLGQALGITREATIKVQADNVNDWVSPELSETITMDRDDRLIHFLSNNAAYYRYWSLYIDDPTNPDFISFANIYLGDYTATTYRNIAPGFGWETVDPSPRERSLNGTLYYDVKTKYDTFKSLQYQLMSDGDRTIVEQLYERFGKSKFMPIAIDPLGITVDGTASKLTRLARFGINLNRNHISFNRYSVSFSLEEVI